MATPRADTASVASGASVWAGRDGAVQISDSTWTPNVGGDGGVLPTDGPQLPANTWLYIATNKITDLIGPTGYATKLGNPDGRASITNAWCGAAWDYVNERLYISGGGHADSHLCENGIYMLDGATMRFSVAKARTATSNAQKYNTSTLTFESGFAASDARNESANCCMLDGSPGASHTYDAMEYIPASVMGNTAGGILMFHYGKEVLDLDTGLYDTSHFMPDASDGVNTPEVDLSNKIVFMDGWDAYHARASYYYRRWNFHPDTREATPWSTFLGGGATSRGQLIETIDAGATFPYSDRAICKMPQRREIANFDGTAVIRVRYGEAKDASATNWAAYTDDITLTSSDGSHTVLMTEANYTDADTDTALFACGMAYDHDNNCIWVVSNLAGGATYKITGLDGTTWTVEQVPDAANLTSTMNGTFERCRVFHLGGETLLVRVPSVTGYAEVMRPNLL